eukprot:g545.t1
MDIWRSISRSPLGPVAKSTNSSGSIIVVYHKSGATLSYNLHTSPDLLRLLVGAQPSEPKWTRVLWTPSSPSWQRSVFVSKGSWRWMTYWVAPSEMAEREISNYLAEGARLVHMVRKPSEWIVSAYLYHLNEFEPWAPSTAWPGGTGVLARDILGHARKEHSNFFASLQRYVIGERSPALQAAQRKTASEFIASKLRIFDADARTASRLRPLLLEEADGPLYSVVLSNELLDEFDPVRLRLSWQASNPPDTKRCRLCSTYREAHVLHPQDAKSILESIRWESKSLPCGLLDTQLLQRKVVERLSSSLSSDEIKRCLPMQLCCTALLLAVNSLMQDTAMRNGTD